MQFVELVHDTPDSWLSMPGAGLDVNDQELPFQISVNVRLSPEPFT
jgi:hypothetical protein